MTVDIGHYFRLHGPGGGGGGGGGGVLPYMAYTGMCRWKGMVFDLSVLKRVYNFLRVCPAVIKLNS